MPPDSTGAPDMAGYYGRLREQGLAPLWDSMAALAPFEPRPRAAAHVWRWAEARARLLEAGGLISAEEAERRVLILANPALPDSNQTTDTLYAGLQLILPGETAAAHRHTQSALRFVLEGRGAYTSVDGVRAEMAPGDFIVTPAWTWHELGHDGGDEPVIWLDGLDVPLVGFLRAGFREEPDGPAAPAVGHAGFAYPYAQAREALDRLAKAGEPDPHFGHVLRYQGPDGDWAMPTIGPSLRLLPAGFSGRPYRSTDSGVAVVMQGAATAEVGGVRFELGERDLLALPGWTPWRLQAAEDCVLFHFSDRPAHEKLGLWREERGA